MPQNKLQVCRGDEMREAKVKYIQELGGTGTKPEVSFKPKDLVQRQEN